MRKFLLTAVTILMTLTMLGSCGRPQPEPSIATEPSASPTESTSSPHIETASTESTQAPSLENTPTETEGGTECEGGDSSHFVEATYMQQIERYYAAISNQWDESAYFDHEMSPLVAYYYDGNPLDNVGFTIMDLNGDNIQELIIGAIKNAEQDPLIFEIWTLNSGEPVMLAQSGSRNRYYMQYAEEDDMWSVAYEAENGAANHAVYYLHLAEGRFEVIQGVIFDAVASENDPWFMAYDLDWDISNDMPIDEDTANAVMEAGRNIYIAIEYLPYSRFS